MNDFWKSEEIFLDGDMYFDRLIKDIDLARELITVEIYIFNDDSLGKQIAEHLINAHKRGVKVQVIIDGVGSYGFFSRLYGLLTEAGIAVKMFHPLPLFHPVNELHTFKQRFKSFFMRLWRINQRNHRKIVTIDSHTMYMGSYNFSMEHTKLSLEKKWKDAGVRVTGENVKVALLHFKKVWKLRDYLRYRKQIKHLITKQLKFSPLRINHSVFMKRFYYRDLLKRIKTAQGRIWVATPYFIPKGLLIRALGKASKRGVDVRILISSKSDVFLFKTLQFFYYPYLLKNNVKIFQYEATVLHAKIFIVDDWMTVGSSNLNHRSILHDLEVDLAIQEQKNKEILLEDYIQSTPPESEITTQHLKQRSLFDKFLSRLFFIFKYWF